MVYTSAPNNEHFYDDTFKSPELRALGYIVAGQVSFYKESTRKHTTQTSFYVSKQI